MSLYKHFLLLFFIHFSIFGQKNDFTPGYFMFPIEPGSQASLSGGFGDLRTNHFHAGIDIRTGGTEGYTVYAAAEGYISRIRVMKGGYGNVLYITHPNGLTTVYGHLKNFGDKIEEYLRKKQTEKKVWEIEVIPELKELLVDKGEIIGISGNTGASGGPHLHFEIRDANENALNPLKFGFAEIQDNVPPIVEKVILKPMDSYSRINGEFGRISIAPSKDGIENYSISKILKARGNIGLELNAYDKSQTSPFRMGINRLEVKIDGKPSYKLNLDKMPFDISKDINVHIDFEIAETNGIRIQKCYVADGNRLSIYETDKFKGKIQINDTALHQVDVQLMDSFGNTSYLFFQIQGDQTSESSEEELAEESNFNGDISTSIIENTLAIRAKNSDVKNAVLQFKGKPILCPLAYKKGNESVYLYDLNKGVVDFIQIGNIGEKIAIKDEIFPKSGENYQEANLKIQFGDALYDTLYLKTNIVGNKLSINNEKIPLKDFINVSWAAPAGMVSPKTNVYYVNDGRKFLNGNWIGNKISFKTKELGDFALITDNSPPNIQPINISNDQLVFSIRDDISGISGFNCYINGEWILMDYEYKSNRLWSIKLDENQTFSGDLSLEVIDNVGNTAYFEVNIEDFVEVQKSVKKKSRKHISRKKSKRYGAKSRKSSTKRSSKKSKRRRR